MSKQKQTKPEQHQGADHSSPYPVSRLAPGFDLVDLAKEIEQADQLIHTTSHARLKVIAEQMQQLKQQARSILQEAQESQRLHRANCNFRKIPGKTYHLYLKDNGRLYFSMLSPDDWQPNGQQFQGSYTLQPDMSWKPVENSNDDDIVISGLIDSL